MPKPTAKSFIESFERLYDQLGPEAFEVLGLTGQLHSGPAHDILHEIFGTDKAALRKAKDEKANYAIAVRQARRISAVRLEDTKPGKALEAQNIYDYFASHNTDLIEAFKEADKVWQHLSRRFIQALEGDIVTAVCGAAEGRVFRHDELPELILNTKIKTTNGVPMNEIRKLYNSDPDNGPYKAFLLICRSEVRLATQDAISTKQPEVIEDRFLRMTYYQLERRRTLISEGKPVPYCYQALTKPERNDKKQKLSERILAAPARPFNKTPKAYGMASSM